jgi:hypothetical protein
MPETGRAGPGGRETAWRHRVQQGDPAGRRGTDHRGATDVLSSPRIAWRQGEGSLGRILPGPCPTHAARLGGLDHDLPRFGFLRLGQRHG